MREWTVIDSAPVPDDEGILVLMQRGKELVIAVDGRELMSNRKHGSEDALADLACDLLDDVEGARILVGGLGMGFTLAAALRRVGPDGSVTVAELSPAVVRWGREHTGRASGHPLRDARAVVYEGDVSDLVEQPPAPWSAILLDVDNGPMALTRPTNGWLYSEAGLRAAWDALIPGGVLAVWSALDDPRFTTLLEAAGYAVDVMEVHEKGRPTPDNSGEHTIWLARRV